MSLKIDFQQLESIMTCINSNRNTMYTCEFSVNRMPPNRRFFIMAGTKEIKKEIMSINKIDIKIIEEIIDKSNLVKIDTNRFRNWLNRFLEKGFSGDMWAMAEGEVVFAGEPLVRITAPLAEIEFIEPIIFSILNRDVNITSKAARIILAASGKEVNDIGKHYDSKISRCLYLAGFTSSSNLEAHSLYNIPLYDLILDSRTVNLETFDISKKIVADTILISTILDYQKIKDKDINIIAFGDYNEYDIFNMANLTSINSFLITKETYLKPVKFDNILVFDNLKNKRIGKFGIPGIKQVFLNQKNGDWSHLIAIDGEINESESLIPLLDCHILKGKSIESDVSLEVSRKYCNANLSSLMGLQYFHNLEETFDNKVPVVAHESLF